MRRVFSEDEKYMKEAVRQAKKQQRSMKCLSAVSLCMTEKLSRADIISAIKREYTGTRGNHGYQTKRPELSETGGLKAVQCM